MHYSEIQKSVTIMKLILTEISIDQIESGMGVNHIIETGTDYFALKTPKLQAFHTEIK